MVVLGIDHQRGAAHLFGSAQATTPRRQKQLTTEALAVKIHANSQSAQAERPNFMAAQAAAQ